jgi:hypothetical protein
VAAVIDIRTLIRHTIWHIRFFLRFHAEHKRQSQKLRYHNTHVQQECACRHTMILWMSEKRAHTVKTERPRMINQKHTARPVLQEPGGATDTYQLLSSTFNCRVDLSNNCRHSPE